MDKNCTNCHGNDNRPDRRCSNCFCGAPAGDPGSQWITCNHLVYKDYCCEAWLPKTTPNLPEPPPRQLVVVMPVLYNPRRPFLLDMSKAAVIAQYQNQSIVLTHNGRLLSVYGLTEAKDRDVVSAEILPVADFNIYDDLWQLTDQGKFLRDVVFFANLEEV